VEEQRFAPRIEKETGGQQPEITRPDVPQEKIAGQDDRQKEEQKDW
jgi:hypothetical protein